MTETGAVVRLIEARQRMRLAVFAIVAGEAGACIDMPWAGSPAAAKAYAEQADAAHELVKAEAAWVEFTERKRREANRARP